MAGLRLEGGEGFAVADTQERFGKGGSQERGAAGEEFVKQRTDAVDVARRSNLPVPSLRLLRRKVVGRAQHFSGQGQVTASIELLGEPEVGQADLVEDIQKDVGRFDVAVQHPLGMRVGDGFGHGACVADGALRRERALPQEFGQTATLHILHGQEGLAVALPHLEHGHDVGMPQSGGRLRLTMEASDAVRTGVPA